MEKADIRQAVKIGLTSKKMTMQELARTTGRGVSCLSIMLKKGSPSLKNTLGLFEGVDAKVVVKYSNGQEVELVVDNE